MTVKLLAFEGSGRKDSMNRKLLSLVADEAKKAGADVTMINLYDYDLPLYNGDLEANEGLPEKVIELKKLFGDHDGYLIASPEYNGGYSPLLKNAIDWITRPAGEGIPTQPFKGKTIGLMATSPGPLSGLRGLYQLNTILFGLGGTVLGDIVAVGNYGNNFNDDGSLKEENHKKAVENLGQKIVKTLS